MPIERSSSGHHQTSQREETGQHEDALRLDRVRLNGSFSELLIREAEVVNSSVAKRSVILAGARTSISLEEDFWFGLREIADHRGVSLSEVLGEIDRERRKNNLSSATRVYVLRFFRATATDKQTRQRSSSSGRSAAAWANNDD